MPSMAHEILVQLAVDPQKRLSWPAYVTVSRAVHGCPAALLVIAPDPVVAGWCAEPIETGVSGFVLRPPVLRRTAVPVVTDLEEAARRPELGVLSAIAHGETEQGATIAAAVLPAIRGLEDDRIRLYYDLVYNSLNKAAPRPGGDDEGLRIPERFREEIRRAGACRGTH